MVNSPSHGIFSCVVWLTIVVIAAEEMVADGPLLLLPWPVAYFHGTFLVTFLFLYFS
jgi:hypothetical protein